MFRRRRKERDPLAHVDPATLPARWQTPVLDALAVRTRWRELVGGLREGPVRDRLAELGGRVDEGVAAVWETVVRAVDVERVADTLDADRVTADYKRAKRDAAADPELVEALTAQFTSVQRVLNAVDETDERLRLLDARLGATVARAAEVTLAAGEGSDALGEELSAVVGELGALRDSLDAIG